MRTNSSGPHYWETQEFAALNAEWRERLAADGFVDIETERGDVHPQSIKGWNKYHKGAAYYEAVTQLADSFPFARPTDRAILLWHSEGLSSRKIAARLAATPGLKPLRYKAVQKIIRRTIKAAGVPDCP